MDLTFAQITAWLGQVWWPFFRLGAALVAMPFFGDGAIPIWVRLLFALSISILIAPLMPAMPAVDPLSVKAIMLAFEQAIWGVFFGFLLHLLFTTMTMLGQIVSMQMGLSMAIMNDPVNGMSVALLGRMFLMFSTLLFLALEGHLLVIDILVQSFYIWPVGSGISEATLHQVVSMVSWMFASALALSMPAIISMLLANISFGVMNRAAPSLNVYALGFPMTMLLGLFSMLIAISGVPSRYTQFVHTTLQALTSYVAGTGI
ncbi:flagellar biosynthetic protein FliR [Photobacterium sp. GJ3]|uniref:flagellar biosynthetic protein FliR n=1 Tax=Photobacterium sp. GJ3 TaxID=2829502 RepID=UPI001B8B75AF|nr:flagellar biosynthetic protein FliR [Photobacterium sp. GJ3]QUJ68693.1 flagellar biosynthetic protein FliR [Photobacterium sp. GJ3]